MAWQGLSGDIIPGNTILDGIRQVAPDAEVTFSEDASAPTAGADVGIVVVGETPYAEGFGDVGGPLWQDNGVPREPKTMRLNDADRAAVDRVCGSIDRCVVVVVSGRPLILTDQLGQMDALVAAWLPGSQEATSASIWPSWSVRISGRPETTTTTQSAMVPQTRSTAARSAAFSRIVLGSRGTPLSCHSGPPTSPKPSA